MTYYETYYGSCKEKPGGSPNCSAECLVCLGVNWVPMGPKTFDEMIAHVVQLVEAPVSKAE